MGTKLYHAGFRGKIARSTLADANEHRDWRIYADFAHVLIGIAQKLYANDGFAVELDAAAYAFDSTTIDLCLSLFPWAFADARGRSSCTANRAAIEGKRIILIDNSLVRGTTSKKIVRMMRDAGASEVHFRLASPPIVHPDYYGIDLPDRGGLLAATHNLDEMRELIGADTLASCRSTACTAPWANPAAIRSTRNSPTIASPAPTRPISLIRPRSNRSPGNCRYWRKRADLSSLRTRLCENASGLV